VCRNVFGDMTVGLIASPAKTTVATYLVNGVAGASYTSVTLDAVSAVGVPLSSAACR
jgi:hypothetical protein